MSDIKDDVARVFALNDELHTIEQKLPIISFPSWLPVRLPTDGIAMRTLRQLLRARFLWKYHFTLETGDDGIESDHDYYDNNAGIRIHNGYTCIWFESQMPIMDYMKEIASCYMTTVNRMVVDGIISDDFLGDDSDVILRQWSHNKDGNYYLYIKGTLCGEAAKIPVLSAKILKAYESGIITENDLVILTSNGNFKLSLNAREYIQNYLREQYHDQANIIWPEIQSQSS